MLVQIRALLSEHVVHNPASKELSHYQYEAVLDEEKDQGSQSERRLSLVGVGLGGGGGGSWGGAMETHFCIGILRHHGCN